MEEIFKGIGEHFSKLFKNIVDNLMYIFVFLGIIIVIFLIALLLEKLAQKKNGVKEPVFTTRKMAVIGMFSAIAAVLMLWEIPLFFAPGFYKLDFSEIPVMIGTFAFGPAAGVMIEFLKILLKLLIKGTSTAFVGDLANFMVGCSFVLPAATIYAFKKTKKNAIIACSVGSICMIVFGTSFNAFYLLPTFSTLFHMPMESIYEMATKVNIFVKSGNMASLVIACVAPLNLIKSVSVSIFTLLVYKPLSPIIKGGQRK